MHTEGSLKQCLPKGNDCSVQRFGFIEALQNFYFAHVKCLNISIITFSFLTEKETSYRTNVRVSCLLVKDKSP